MTPDHKEQTQPEKSALEKRLDAYVDGLKGLEQQINQLHRSRDMQLGAIEAIQVLIKEEKEAAKPVKVPDNVVEFPAPKA